MGQRDARSRTVPAQLSEKRARTVADILSAAMGIIAEDGVAALSMSTLASRADVSRQTLYNYFPDVGSVIAGIVEMGEAGIADLADGMAAAIDAPAALEVFVAATVGSVRAGHPSPVALAAALPAELRGRMRAHGEQAERLIIELLDRGVAEGGFRTDLDIELDGRILYRAAFAGAELAREPGVDVDALAARLSEDLLAIVSVCPERS